MLVKRIVKRKNKFVFEKNSVQVCNQQDIFNKKQKQIGPGVSPGRGNRPAALLLLLRPLPDVLLQLQHGGAAVADAQVRGDREELPAPGGPDRAQLVFDHQQRDQQLAREVRQVLVAGHRRDRVPECVALSF